MKRLTRTLLVSVLIVAVAAISVAPAGAAKKGTDRPFKASGDGFVTAAPFEDCEFDVDPILGGVLVCVQDIEVDPFIGTHIGRSTNTSDGFLTLYLDQGCITPSGTFGVEFVSIQFVTIVAANGDELYVDTEVSGCGDGETPAEPSGTYTITEGTGRFLGATGSGALASDVGPIDPTSGASTLSTNWYGTISY